MKQELTIEQKKVEIADEYNDVLGSLGKLDDTELTSLMETGKLSNGEEFKDEGEKTYKPELLKHLAGLAKSGVSRMTWNMANNFLKEFWEVLDVIGNDLVGPFKRMLGFSG